MKILTALFLVGGLLIAGTSSYAFAQTYGYIDQSGNLRTITADTAQDALVASAPNRAHNSGVMEMGQSTQSTVVVASTNPNMHIYGYVTTSGTLAFHTAGSAEEAIMYAPNRAPNSGVMLIAK